MKAAILNFAQINAENKTLILGDMLELGNYSPVEHQSIVDLIKEMKFESVYLVGKEFKQTERIWLRVYSRWWCRNF
jgi:UDP-N-acetylmuramoyl-tripeptide--D-alanyl-D-alanine ligase